MVENADAGVVGSRLSPGQVIAAQQRRRFLEQVRFLCNGMGTIESLSNAGNPRGLKPPARWTMTGDMLARAILGGGLDDADNVFVPSAD